MHAFISSCTEFPNINFNTIYSSLFNFTKISILEVFSAHPFDDFIVQQAAQMPWILSHLLGMITGKYFKISYLTYGITLSWLVFIGMRAHTRHSFGGSNHCKHHDDPSKGPYSFSGIPEGVYDLIIFYAKSMFSTTSSEINDQNEIIEL